MDTHLYFTVAPEALVGSMLPPEEFAPYLATRSKKNAHGRAIFFEIDRKALPAHFDLSEVDAMKPHPDGSPKCSQTVSMYRAMEHIPLAAFGRMFAITHDGKYHAISPQFYMPPAHNGRHLRLYQELCPLHPTVVSKLQPLEFGHEIAAQNGPIHVPRLLFADLALGQLADPLSDIPLDSLPYTDLDTIREAIGILMTSKRDTLVIDRAHTGEPLYRTVKEGFFVADAQQTLRYPFPTREEREGPLHNWWRSAEAS